MKCNFKIVYVEMPPGHVHAWERGILLLAELIRKEMRNDAVDGNCDRGVADRGGALVPMAEVALAEGKERTPQVGVLCAGSAGVGGPVDGVVSNRGQLTGRLGAVVGDFGGRSDNVPGLCR